MHSFNKENSDNLVLVHLLVEAITYWAISLIFRSIFFFNLHSFISLTCTYNSIQNMG
jgi:hypothetical protein